MKNISAWAIKHPIFPLVLFMVLTFVGIVSFVRLPINLNPDISFPMVSVSVTQPGAAPTEMEEQILQKIAMVSMGSKNVGDEATKLELGKMVITTTSRMPITSIARSRRRTSRSRWRTSAGVMTGP